MKKLRFLPVLLALLTVFICSAGGPLDEFIELYNDYAPENDAPQLNADDFYFVDDSWCAEIDRGMIAFTFDENGYTEYVLVETVSEDSICVTAFLNAWYVSDSETDFSELSAYVAKCISTDDYVLEAHGNWMFACEKSEGSIMMGIVWTGNSEPEKNDAPEPEATPDLPVNKNESETKDGKTIYKA